MAWRVLPGQQCGASWGGAGVEDGAITYLHTDRTGSVVATSDSQSHVLARYPNLLESQRILSDEFRDRSVFNGVDLRTGDFTYTAPPDLTLGDGEFPWKFTVQRQYRADETRCMNCPFGWTPIGQMGTVTIIGLRINGDCPDFSISTTSTG